MRRLLATTILRVARPFPLLSFRWADSHGHAATTCERDAAGELGRRIELALAQNLKLDVPFEPVRLRPIRDMWHLASVFKYVLGQDEHHGFQHDPLHDASNLPDLLGWRVNGAWTGALVREHLPRVTREEILEKAGVADPDRCEPNDWGPLLDAAASAFGLANLEGMDPLAIRARQAAVRVASASLSTLELATKLTLTTRTVRRLKNAPCDKVGERAVRQQLVLRERLPDLEGLPADGRPSLLGTVR